MRSRSITIATNILLLAVVSFAQVDSIAVKVLPPYPKEKGIIGLGYSILNAIHLDSRPWTVKRLCPIKSKNETDSASFSDAERIMRSYPFWSDAKIRLDKNSRKLDIAIQELWTTKLDLRLRYVADEFEWGGWLEEENFSGLGAYASVGYAHYIENNWWETAMKLYGFPTHKWDLSAYYNKNGGEWSAGGKFLGNENYIDNENLLFLSAEAESVSITRYYSGAVVRDTMDIDKISVTGEYLFNRKNFYLGIAAGYFDKSLRIHDRGGEWDCNPSIFTFDTSYSWIPVMVRFSYLSRKFFQTKNVDNFSRFEDIPIGLSTTGAVGLNFGYKHNIDDDKKSASSAKVTGAFLLGKSYNYIGFKYKAMYDYEYFGIHFRTFAPTDSSSIIRFGAGADIMWLQSDFGDKYLVADGRTGFRGFPAYYEVAYRNNEPFVKLSAEMRIFPKFEIFTLRPGFALFADAGGTYWNNPEIWSEYPYHKNDGWMVDFGASLRICSTRSSRGNVNRFEISYSPQTKTISFTIDSGQAQSFYLPLGLSSLLSE